MSDFRFEFSTVFKKFHLNNQVISAEKISNISQRHKKTNTSQLCESLAGFYDEANQYH